jgi:hypothetical protein
MSPPIAVAGAERTANSRFSESTNKETPRERGVFN